MLLSSISKAFISKPPWLACPYLHCQLSTSNSALARLLSSLLGSPSALRPKVLLGRFPCLPAFWKSSPGALSSLSSLSPPSISILFLSPSRQEPGSPASFCPPSHCLLTSLLIDQKPVGARTFSNRK